MHPACAHPRGSWEGSPDSLPTAPVRRAWRSWLLAAFFLTFGLMASVLVTASAHADIGSPDGASLAAVAGHPMAPGGEPVHLLAMAESDGETVRATRATDASPMSWPARHAARLAAPRLPAIFPAGTTARAYRSPPAHAPPAARQG